MDETYVDSPEVFQNAAVGHVRMITQDDPIPVDWRECDGVMLHSRQWPLYVQALGIKGSTFTVPAPQRTLDGYRFIVKMGQEPPPEPTPEEIEMRREATEQRREEMKRGINGVRGIKRQRDVPE